jgi:hypothetical protein
MICGLLFPIYLDRLRFTVSYGLLLGLRAPSVKEPWTI